MEEIVYLNGSLLPRSQAKISVFDHGFLYGYGLFETMRAYSGKIFLLERHIKRLTKSAETIGLNLEGVDFSRACRDTVAANHLKDARLRLTVTRGELDAFPGYGLKSAPTVLVTAKHYSPPSPEKYVAGYRAGIASIVQNSGSPLARLKSTSYLLNVLARGEAEAAVLDEMLLLNERGCLTEGSISNLFFVTGSDGLVTPGIESGLLPGVTREVVIELAKSSGMTISEAEIRPAGLGGFSGAFLTNSLIEIMPLARITDRNGKVIFEGTAQPVIRKLMAAYRELQLKETG